MPRHFDQPLTIRQRLLAVRPKRDPGVRARLKGDAFPTFLSVDVRFTIAKKSSRFATPSRQSSGRTMS
jgi:hypothetical protein